VQIAKVDLFISVDMEFFQILRGKKGNYLAIPGKKQ